MEPKSVLIQWDNYLRDPHNYAEDGPPTANQLAEALRAAVQERSESQQPIGPGVKTTHYWTSGVFVPLSPGLDLQLIREGCYCKNKDATITLLAEQATRAWRLLNAICEDRIHNTEASEVELLAAIEHYGGNPPK